MTDVLNPPPAPLAAADAPADRSADGSEAVRELLVRSTTWQADGVLSLRLVDPSGAPLPPWRPGAHLDLVLPSGLVRQYSLCGSPEDRHGYTVAVLLVGDGRGGSREVHETALVGRTVSVRGPRNRFPLVEAEHHLFIAGGIGITPILAMAREVNARGRDWRLAYGGRSRSSMAFTEELRALGPDRIAFVPQDECGPLDLDALLADVQPDTAVYCCGPEGLLAAVQQRHHDSGAAFALHFERFGAPVTARSAADSGGSGAPGDAPVPASAFEVELRRSGQVLTVPPDRSILDTIREVAPQVMSSCEEGFCGTCETPVLEGVPEHHDTLLSERERERGKTMMICVGRSKTPRLVLDL
ncbi:PDR/VanB family oxidoreductase [Streptomyces sp. SCSIO 75703]|uniref:PDR/VanB family oxidoreductase n=1 Tax=unclassified Streptomyces TaxID=2593676 RepID=UPI00099B278F|nr:MULTISPECIES: PDR/VanB family oxidoreductase [unclassified Streptomyces]